MAELNKVLMIGRLTRDPEIRYTPSGAPVAEFRLASNHTFRTKEEKREEVCFIDVNLWGRSAETAKEYLQKGREILIEGRLRFENWETKEGEKRSTYRIVADRFQFIGSRGTGGGNDRYEAAASAGGSSETQRTADEPEADDDLPF